MTLGNYFFPQGDSQTVINYDSFEGEDVYFLYSFFCKYSIWTRGGRHHKAPMNPKHWIHS